MANATATLNANETDGEPVANHGITSRWTTAIQAGGLGTADASGGAVDPDKDCTASTTVKIDCGGRSGTHLLARVKHICSTNGTLTVRAWGRTEASGGWMILPTKDGSTSLTIAVLAAAIITNAVTPDGGGTAVTYSFTDAADLNKAFDRCGCRYVIFSITTALAATGYATASLEVKPL